MPEIRRSKRIDREPAVAGIFYSATHKSLLKEVEDLMDNTGSEPLSEDIRAILVPHAGYQFSGSVAASAFRTLDGGHTYDNIILIGSSHQVRFNGAAIYVDGDFLTPLGRAKVNTILGNQLIESGSLFSSYNEAHKKEHTLEVQVPFLQYIFGENLNLIPIVIGTDRPEQLKDIAKQLLPLFNQNNLFIISSDFSHYPSYEKAIELDAESLSHLIEDDPHSFVDYIRAAEKEKRKGAITPMCGWTSGVILKHLTGANKNLVYKPLLYSNSGDSENGDKIGVVGYHAIAITEDVNNRDEIKIDFGDIFRFSIEDQRNLLDIARRSIKSMLNENRNISSAKSPDTRHLIQKFGVFVTLRIDKKLRGCIGRLTSNEPLYETVKQMSVAAAYNDSRFDPLNLQEYNKIIIEISLLSPMRRITDIDEIVIGKHGVMIKKDYKSGTFLPQVAYEQGWSRMELLDRLSTDKAGLGPGGWRDAEIYIYEAFVFDEESVVN